MPMKKIVSIIVLCMAALWSMSAQSKFSYSLELKAGAGLGHGPAALFMPEFAVQYDLGNGFIAGAGTGLRFVLPCFSYRTINDKFAGRSFIQELDMPLFLRIGYGKDKFYANLDTGFALGIAAGQMFVSGGGKLRPIYNGLFFEPQAGWRISDRRTLALGILFQQSRVKDNILTQTVESTTGTTTTRELITPATTIRYGFLF